jgi:hypothetical protein
MDIEQVFELSLIAVDEMGIEGAAEPERVLATIWWLEAEVNNGGFDQYFHNSAGDMAFYAAIALSKIGAHKMASITQKALDIFGSAGPPKDRTLRMNRLEEIQNKNEELYEQLIDKFSHEFTDYPDNIKELLDQYVQSKF